MTNMSSSIASVARNLSQGREGLTLKQNFSAVPLGSKELVPSEVKLLDKVDKQQTVKFDDALVVDAVKKINEFIAPTAARVEFSIDAESDRTVVKVIDLESKEVIRQFPSEDVLAMSKALDKLQGLLVKQTA